MSAITSPAADWTDRPGRAPVLESLDHLLGRPVSCLAFVFLALAAGVIHRLSHGDLTAFEAAALYWGVVVLWPVFVLEGLLRLTVCRRPAAPWWTRLGFFLGVCLFPPVRIGGRAYADAGKFWLPGLGWSVVDRRLRNRLDRAFRVPMLLVTLLVLPFLAMEYFWLDTVREHFGLSLLLDVGTAVIWLAFAVELIVMVSVADHKVQYCLHNWMDVAVVLLPLVDFLPILRLLRLTRLAELQQLSRLGRLYRLRGVLSKVWRTMLLLEAVQYLLGNYREKRLRHLRELLAEHEEEIVDLRREIAELEALPAAQPTSPSRPRTL